MIELNFKLLDKDAILPSLKHDNDSGLDLYSTKEYIIEPKSFMVIPLGIACQSKFTNFNDKFDWKVELKIEGTSGNASKYGVFPIGGIIDEGYTGEWKVILCNFSNESITIAKGGKVAQVIPTLIPNIFSINKVDDFEIKTDRGDSGFGSTGTVRGYDGNYTGDSVEKWKTTLSNSSDKSDSGTVRG